MNVPVDLRRARFSVVEACAFVVALQTGLPVGAQGTHCQPEVMDLISVTESGLVDTLDIGPRKSAERGVVRYRACPGAYLGNLPPRPAGRARLPLPFSSLDSLQLSSQARGALGQLAGAIQSDALVGFAFRVEASVESSGDPQVDLAQSSKRAESVIAVLTGAHGLPAARFAAVGLGGTDPVAQGYVTFVTQRQRR